MASQEPSTTQKKLLQLLLPLFKKCPSIDKYQVTNSYNSVFHKSLSVKKYGYSSLERMYTILDVFNEEGKNVSISRPKLLELLLQPLLNEPCSNLETTFENLNGFKSTVLCEYCDVSSLQELIKELHSHKSTVSSTKADTSSCSGIYVGPFSLSAASTNASQSFQSQQQEKRKPQPFIGLQIPSPRQEPTTRVPLLEFPPLPIASNPPIMRQVVSTNRESSAERNQPPIKKPVSPMPECVLPINPGNATEGSQEPNTKQRMIIESLLPLFKVHPLINRSTITNTYAAVFGKGLSVRNHGYSSLKQMYSVLGIFNEEGTKVSISRSKLLELLLRPLLQEQHSRLAVAFENLNGFKPEVLCEYCEVSSVHELVKEIRLHKSTLPQSSTEVATSSCSGISVGPFSLSTTSTIIHNTSPSFQSQQQERQHQSLIGPQVTFPRPEPTMRRPLLEPPSLMPFPIQSINRPMIPYTGVSSAVRTPIIKNPVAPVPKHILSIYPVSSDITTEESHELNIIQRMIIKLLLPLFKVRPSINKDQITNTFGAIFRTNRGLSVKKHGYSSLDHMYSVLDIFNENDKSISISRPKLLELLLQPLVQILHEPHSSLDASFEKLNGFKPTALCEYCNVSSLHELMQEIHSQYYITSQSSPKNPQSKRNPSHSHPQTPVPHHHIPSPSVPQPFYLGSVTNNTMAGTSQALHTEQTPSHYPNPQTHPRDDTFVPPLPGHCHPHVLSEEDIRTPVHPQFKRSENSTNVINKIEEYLKSFVNYLSKQGKHLPAYLVDKEVKSICNKASSLVGRRIDFKNIKFGIEFDKLQKRLNEFIRTFCWNCPITSLFELQRTVCEFEKVSDFEELKVGPIVKHPEVIRLFKVPEDVLTVPEITAYDIHMCLTKYINKSKKTDTRDVEEFMTFLADKFSVSSPLHLCVRISSFPLACSVSDLSDLLIITDLFLSAQF